ncbi:calcium uniporter protein 4, mitochondrial-like [Phalaenopsis equestris]|uniref:calcium uniporter protein 4, mitochondrial-like n=1 Tax=Phalaenopsis equestris TaxID=78828 RepID=UPI0009E5E052|nr:calcium uniporter protein 4, mitochondrial-like [Phalaenopsis equestris]
MAFGKSIAHRLLDAVKNYSVQIRSGAGDAGTQARGSVFRRLLPDSGNRWILWRPIFQEAVPPDRIWMPLDVKLFDRISEPSGYHLRRDILSSPHPISVEGEEEKRGAMGMTMEEVRKVLKASQMELVRSRLRENPKSFVSLSEFLRICCEVSSEEQGPKLARSLDESAAVIVIGNVVFLKPDQVARAIERAIPLSLSPLHDQREQELRKLEQQKAMIDKLAEAKVRKELWCGLAFLAAQTAGFMRLTFWELSWDVMEPICFYVTSIYFMAGYGFFMRTSTDPSFEGFFKSRFATKQKQLMKAHNFDLCRFNELKRVCRAGELLPFQAEQVAASCCDDGKGR